jgi:C-terminal processing protease CtpA/Prc
MSAVGRARRLGPLVGAALLLSTLGCSDGSQPSRDDGATGTGATGGGPGSGGSGGLGGASECSGAQCPPCSLESPTGPCPGARICREGACIVDLDPGTPADTDAGAFFDKIWSHYDTEYGAFPAKTVDWQAVHDEILPRIEETPTAFGVRWLVSQAVARIGDGHTAAYSLENCDVDPGFGRGVSNVGACATEIDGRLYVYRAAPDNPTGLAVGDELLSFDGRDAELALSDLAAQPRCYTAASTAAQQRSQLVASLLFRDEGDESVRVRHADGSEEDLAIDVSTQSSELLACDGRIGPVEALVDHGYGVLSAVLAGDVLYVRLTMFGGYDANQQFVDEPVIEILRGLVQDAGSRTGLLLDLRANGGGYPSVYMALASWFYAGAEELFQCRSKTGPGHEDHGPWWSMISAPDPELQYQGALAVLVSPRTMSAGDFSSAFLHLSGRANTFGAPSGGGFGNANSADLDANWRIGFNDILCADLDGNLLEGHPPPVDHPVVYAVDDLVAGKDTVIESARAWLTGR